MKVGADATIPESDDSLTVSAELPPITTLTAEAGAELPDVVSFAVTVSAYSLPFAAPAAIAVPTARVATLLTVVSVNDAAPVPPSA